ncbi:5-formyltetrahydrofolate cyclo-ligase [Gammaproteobacteria bacterium]
MTRVQLRRAMRRKRRALPPAERARCAIRLTRRLQGFRPFCNSRRVAIYLPNDGEMDLTLLLRRATRMGKCCHLPLLCPLGGRQLWFGPYRSGEPLRLNRLRIPEPARPGLRRVRAWALDLVIVPLVAFDAAGNRLGMGGGYYDRTLAFLAHRRYWRKPRVVGVAYDFQRVAALKPQPWDIPLDAVVTEARIYSSSHGGK